MRITITIKYIVLYVVISTTEGCLTQPNLPRTPVKFTGENNIFTVLSTAKTPIIQILIQPDYKNYTHTDCEEYREKFSKTPEAKNIITECRSGPPISLPWQSTLRLPSGNIRILTTSVDDCKKISDSAKPSNRDPELEDCKSTKILNEKLQTYLEFSNKSSKTVARISFSAKTRPEMALGCNSISSMLDGFSIQNGLTRRCVTERSSGNFDWQAVIQNKIHSDTMMAITSESDQVCHDLRKILTSNGVFEVVFDCRAKGL